MPIRRRMGIATRRPRQTGKGIPRATAQHAAARIACKNPGAAVIGHPAITVMPAILHPFPHIPAHVVEAKGVPLLARDRVGRSPPFSSYQATVARPSPPQYARLPPARQAYSHSASEGSRYTPRSLEGLLWFNHSMNACASSQDICTTGVSSSCRLSLPAGHRRWLR